MSESVKKKTTLNFRDEKVSPSKFIITLGTFYSGAGAVHDFLTGRGDSYDPLNGEEYLLPQVPYGIMSLHASCGLFFSHSSAHLNIVKFKKIAYMLGRKHTKYNPGMGYENNINGYYKLIDSYVDSLVVSSLPYNSHWEWFTAPFFKRIYNRLKIINKGYAKDKYLPTIGVDFVEKTRELHLKMFGVHDKKYILLNQAGSGWNPVNSTDYFPNRKVILVVRDPRDQYCELKKHKNAHSLSEFIGWYKEMMLRIESVDSDFIKIIRFEEFVERYSVVSDEVCDFLSIDKGLYSNYDPVASSKNIGIYKGLLDKDELRLIERNLKEYLYNKI